MNRNKITDALMGVAIADAVGVPYEFKSPSMMRQHPATDMTGYGTYNQPPGTWSDDSSLTFCLAEALTEGYDLAKIAANFVAWRNKNYWTAHNELFDIGITTRRAINDLQLILETERLEELTLLKYKGDEYDNGNGALMRILPLLFYIKGKPIAEQFDIIRDVCALTHRHIRGAMCCLIYLRLAEHLLEGKNKEESYYLMQKEILNFWQTINFSANESKLFIRLIEADIRKVPMKDLRSGGYVMESIEASIWCFLQGDTYAAIVLSAVNLGHDTDTTAAIAGGLAGLYYGMEGMPEKWIQTIARRADIMDLGERLRDKTADF